MPPGSEPASGSVRPKQPISSPRARPGRYFRRWSVVAIGVDRIHDERALHAHHRAEAGVDPLDLARDEAIGDVARAGAAEFLRQRHPEQARLAHQPEELGSVFSSR